MNDLHITARQFKSLVSAVLPMASDDHNLPVLNAIKIESRGKWLVASATDRFRLGIKRLAANEGEWPEWSALLPTTTVKAILADFKPSRRDADPEMIFTLDEESLRVKADGALLDMLSADISYPIETGQFPKVGKLVLTAIADESESPVAHAGFNWKFLAGFQHSVGDAGAMGIKITSPNKPALIANGDDFVGILMPRKASATFPVDEDWTGLLADGPSKPEAAAKPRKRAAKKKAVA